MCDKEMCKIRRLRNAYRYIYNITIDCVRYLDNKFYFKLHHWDKYIA